MNNADLPANPIVNSDGFPTLGSFFESTADGGPEAIGLTKREHFAGLAMQGMIVVDADNYLNEATIAKIAVNLADALLAELDKVQQ
jgi:hypothetical protein